MTAAKTTKAVEKETKFMQQEEFTHEATGTKYVFQYPGTRAMQTILDDAKRNGYLSDTIYNEHLMEQVIVSPQTDWEYWDENDGYTEVMSAADRFLGKLLHR